MFYFFNIMILVDLSSAYRAPLKCFVITPKTKVEKNAKKSFVLSRLVHKFATVSRSTT